ncbi:hypothetical protein MPSEU_000532700 [Mayamaea pseudoterrestris]|nr:hypothetical protein MPSEU_000532700 [Mayamaea pseudoterrestris]
MNVSAESGEYKETESPLRRLVACGTLPPTIQKALLGNCGIVCTSFPNAEPKDQVMATSLQFVELHGLRFIGLGALVDELTPHERVYDTLEQLTTRTERMISVGYLIDIPPIMAENRFMEIGQIKVAETVPLDVWNMRHPNNLSVTLAEIVEHTKNKRYKVLLEKFAGDLGVQMARPNRGNNKYLAGITAHNLGVVSILAGRPDDAITYFRKAIHLKTVAFGENNPEVALSCDELGIQLFAKSDFEGAIACFKEALAVRNRLHDMSRRPQQAMVLNYMACCHFELGNHDKALSLLQEADELQQMAIGSSAQADLDLLHVAIVICNCGYLMLALKDYENALSLLEEALLIQQSVLGDQHRAVRDTLSNLEFANAFHL